MHEMSLHKMSLHEMSLHEMSLMDRLKAEHKEILSLLQSIESHLTTKVVPKQINLITGSKLEILERIVSIPDLCSVFKIREVISIIHNILVPHMEFEEKHLYPALVRFIEANAKELLSMHFEHDFIKEIISVISSASPEKETLEEIISSTHAFVVFVRDHLECEEKHFFPLVNSSIPLELLEELELKYNSSYPSSSKINGMFSASSTKSFS